MIKFVCEGRELRVSNTKDGITIYEEGEGDLILNWPLIYQQAAMKALNA